MRLFTIIVVLAALSGCRSEPHTFSTFTTIEPCASDLEGTYKPTQKTKMLIRDAGKYAPGAETSIVISKDRIQFNNIPDWWRVSGGEPEGHLDTGGGQWWLLRDRNTGWWEILLNFSSKKASLSTSMQLVGDRPPYILHLTIGDPDQEVFMQFEKISVEE